MSGRADGDRKYRRVLTIGIAISVVAHAVIFVYGRLRVQVAGEAGRPNVQLVDLVEDATITDVPLEVVEVRQNEAEEAGGSPGGMQLAAIPNVPQISAALSSAVAQPTVFLERLEQSEQPENPAASYATVSDFLVSTSPNPRPLRPIDDRPVAVLAAIGAGRGVGVGIGGGHCKPQRPPMIRRSAVNFDVVRGPSF
jgi:hypothetical protein